LQEDIEFDEVNGFSRGTVMRKPQNNPGSLFHEKRYKDSAKIIAP
jgi:hypothetical protein